MIETPNRLQHISGFMFQHIAKQKAELVLSGVDVIDLTMGVPDLPTPPHIREKLIEAMGVEANWSNSPYSGTIEFRQAVADYYKRNYKVELDPETEVLALIGSKEGITHLVPAMIDPGDYVLVPDPGYPVYESATALASGQVSRMPLLLENDFLCDFTAIPEAIHKKAKLMFLNYPNNPTGATVELPFFQAAVEYAKQHRIAIANDSTYSMITYGGYKAPSILEVPGAKEIAVEFGSLSKTYGMTGWRMGYVVGNREMIRLLSIIKSHTDMSQFIPIQKAGAYALTSDQDCIQAYNRIYEERMMLMTNTLKSVGFEVKPARGAFYIWAPVPGGKDSVEFVAEVLRQTGVMLSPGRAFGEYGEGYFRVSLSLGSDRLREAGERLKSLSL